ncbi:MAG: cytidine deaminase [Proteobacteria bacterium]|nr:cytidine deaminase [Pseudomonadota bacterium]
MEKITENNSSHLVNFVPVKSQLQWDEYFMLQAMLASYKSKDPHTKVGCVFVDENNHQITMGYNGAVAGIDESQIPWGNDRTVPLEYQKYGYVIHSEANAISHARGNLKGSRGYVTLFPCNECAKLIASQRVGEIIYLSDKYRDTSENRIAKKIFDLAGIRYRQLILDQTLVDGLQTYLSTLLKNL